MFFRAFVLLTLVPIIDGAASPGCPCIDARPALRASGYLDGSVLLYSPAGGDAAYAYPETYGSLACDTHDSMLEPVCVGGVDQPEWCNHEFCFVDPANCDKATSLSSYFPSAGVYYSYETCGSVNTFDGWIADGEDRPLCDVLSLCETYLRSTKDNIQLSYPEIADLTGVCTHKNDCTCTTCDSPGWDGTPNAMNLDGAGVYWRPEANVDTGGEAARQLSCLASPIEASYTRIASLEASAEIPIAASMYFGHQDTGALVSWPARQRCNPPSSSPNAYDPRFRPWYAAAASGPKSVVIVIDRSASMLANDRITLAKAATLTVLDTFTDYDYVSLVVFSSTAMVYSPTLVAATVENKALMKEWAEEEIQPGGGTNFGAAFSSAIDLFKSTPAATCNRMILFLTDGDDPTFTVSELDAELATLSGSNPAIFTYSLGAEAAAVVMKDIACAHKGIAHNVLDTDDLKSIMASYYVYFATGAALPRWTFYEDFTYDVPLITGCLPVFDPSQDFITLIGVTCLDMNILVSPLVLETHNAYTNFRDAAEAESRTCTEPILDECHIEVLRARISASAVCSAPLNTTGCAPQATSNAYSPRSCVSWPTGFQDPTCTDRVLNGDEITVDCGGSCPASAECAVATTGADEIGEPVPASSSSGITIIAGAAAGMFVVLVLVAVGVLVVLKRSAAAKSPGDGHVVEMQPHGSPPSASSPPQPVQASYAQAPSQPPTYDAANAYPNSAPATAYAPPPTSTYAQQPPSSQYAYATQAPAQAPAYTPPAGAPPPAY